MVKINVKNTAGDSRNRKEKIMQVEVFPERLLGFETARKLIGRLNEVEGITRIVIYGPRLPAENPDDLLNGKFGTPEKRFLNIKGEEVELTTQVGRIWIELEDIGVKDKVKEACEKALPFSFELYEGLYLRRKKTVSDYVRRGPDADDRTLGMFDPKDKRAKCCGQAPKMDCENDHA